MKIVLGNAFKKHWSVSWKFLDFEKIYHPVTLLENFLFLIFPTRIIEVDFFLYYFFNSELKWLYLENKILASMRIGLRFLGTWNFLLFQDIPSDSLNNRHKWELSFEYLMSKNCLKWITVASEQAMLMSVCLQSMVDELLNQKSGADMNNMQVHRTNYAPLSYIRRDGSSGRISDSSSSDTISSLVSGRSAGGWRMEFNLIHFSRMRWTWRIKDEWNLLRCVGRLGRKSQRRYSSAVAENPSTMKHSRALAMTICSLFWTTFLHGRTTGSRIIRRLFFS